MSHHRRLHAYNWTSFTSRKWETGDCEVFELLDNTITNDARWAREIKCRIAMAKEGSFHQQI
jgi:hypothetical protein